MRMVCVDSLDRSRSTRSSQAQVLVQQRAAGRALRAFADQRPGAAQVGDVLGQLVVAGLLGIGAQDEAAAAVAGQGLHARAQLLAQLLRAIFWLMPMWLSCGRKDQHAPGDADLRRQPRALGADGVLDDLHRQRLAFEDQALDGHLRRVGPRRRPPCRSATCRKAARSRPMSMKALCMPGSTRTTLPR